MAAAAQAKGDVVSNAEVGIERIALEHHRHIPAGWRQGRDITARHHHLPLTRRFQSSQKPQQRALAATRGAHQHEEFAVAHLKINALEHLHSSTAAPWRVLLAQLAEGNLGHAGSSADARLYRGWPDREE